MKIRSGFVANSSSSSFIVIQEGSKQFITVEDDNILMIGDKGEYEFGWEHIMYHSVYDKINFAYIQADYLDNNVWKEMLYEVIKEETGMDSAPAITTQWDSANFKLAYIDHQSASTEGENVEMFESKETLRTFLFSSSSYIQGSNDNDYYED